MAKRKQLEIEISSTGEMTMRVKCVPGQARIEESSSSRTHWGTTSSTGS